MGAQAIGDKHPWMGDVALVLNLEARGSGGTVLMYETNEDNIRIPPAGGFLTVLVLTLAFPYLEFRLLPRADSIMVEVNAQDAIMSASLFGERYHREAGYFSRLSA